MNAHRHVLVVVPAHDEESSVGVALTAVVEALAAARADGVIDRADVVVSAHRCADATADVAREALQAHTAGAALVLVDETSGTVGEVRDTAVRRALAAGAGNPAGWLLSTDADSLVPRGWVAGLLGAAGAAVAVAGLVELVDWQATEAARAAYDAIIAAGMVDDHRHRHVYAANLAVRLDAYLAVGGFPAVRHGEETALLAALVGRGYTVTSTRQCVVRTSGRMPGRAAEGLGALLDRLAAPAPSTAGSPASVPAVGAGVYP